MLERESFTGIFRQRQRRSLWFPELALLCVGGGAFDSDERRLFRRLGLENRVFQTGLDEAALSSAYAGALALVFPSLAEGFGLPIIEAQSMGCVPVLSNIPCFREIGGEGALFFAPGNADECSAALQELAANRVLKQRLIERAGVGLKRFDWRRIRTTASCCLRVAALTPQVAVVPKERSRSNGRGMRVPFLGYT